MVTEVKNYIKAKLIKKPLVCKRCNGQSSRTHLQFGKEALKALDNKVIKIIQSQSKYSKNRYLDLFVEHGIDYATAYDDAYRIVDNSNVGNTLRYAVQEYVIGEAARQDGYDSIIGYSKGRDGKEFISEIFDIRELTYPKYDTESEINTIYFRKRYTADVN